MTEKYRIEFKRSVYKEFKKIPPKDLKKILDIIKRLSYNPRPSGYKKLAIDDKYRIRYRFYRILYSIEDDILVVTVVKVGHRNKIY